jgi:hypothetical protein
MKIIEMEEDVWQELQRRSTDDVILRGLLKLMHDRTSPSTTEQSAFASPNPVQPKRPDRAASVDDPSRSGISPRELGKRVRHRYAMKHGMNPRGGIVYEHNETEVIMPFATERNPDHWFLGAPVTTLKKGERQFLILLCWKDNAELDFVIPPEKVADLISRLTFNSNGQFMFNVAKRCAGHYELLVPGRPMDITKYLHAANQLNEK